MPTKSKPSVNQALEENSIKRMLEANKFVPERFKNSILGNKYLPPSEKGSLIYHIAGGAELGGAAADPNGIMYVNGNNMLWWIQMRKSSEGNQSSSGERLFNQNGSACHGIDKNAAANQAFLNLEYKAARLNKSQILKYLESGRGRIPFF